MSSLESSLERFFDALGELERAVEGRVAEQAGGEDMAALEDELQGLRDERLALAEELERLRSQTLAYEQLTDDVTVGLDSAIKEIRSVLD